MGAMERYTWVRFAGKLTNCHKTHIAKVSIPLGQWRKCPARFKMQELTDWDANHEHVHSSRSVQGSQFKGTMERVGSIGTKTHAALQKQRSWE